MTNNAQHKYMRQISEDNIYLRLNMLKLRAAHRYNLSPDKCHLGHALLEAMLQNPERVAQIDGLIDESETNESLAKRTVQLASAMTNAGLKAGDTVVIMGPNHLDLVVPFYALHYIGCVMCCVDPTYTQEDLNSLFGVIDPKIVFCQNECVEKVNTSLQHNKVESILVTFDNKENNLETFVQQQNGTEVGFEPTQIDSKKAIAWYMLTSGTTGMPKVAMMTYDNVLNAVCEWWMRVPERVTMTMCLTSTQWMSALIFFISTPLKPFTRLQCSAPMAPPLMVKCIMKYRPSATGWTPYLLSQFVNAEKQIVDLSCFRYILVGGAAMEQPILEKFRKICNAVLILAYGMTEILVPIFDYNDSTTPFGSAGKEFPYYQYKLIDEQGNKVKEGELLVKSNVFFEGYLKNVEDTRAIFTEDGWLRTGDIFRIEDDGNYYFVERKKILIRYKLNFVSPLQLEQAIKRHPHVAEACVVGMPNAETMEIAVAAILQKNGSNIAPKEIFDAVKANLPTEKHLHGGLFFVEGFPMTPSGKIHRTKVIEMALAAKRIMPE